MAETSEVVGHLEEPGLWVQVIGEKEWTGRPALFLDRDGTLNVDTGFPRDPAEIELLDTMLPAIRAANAADVACVIVTNQSGIARGLLGWEDFSRVNARLFSLLGQHGCRIDTIIACAYHGEGRGALAIADHPMRKPNPGMLLKAADRVGVDLSRSVMAGDREADVEAGRRAGVAKSLRVLPGGRIVDPADGAAVDLATLVTNL